MTSKDDLKSELKALLEKHHCYIAFSCDECSDLHGVTGESIEVIIHKTNEVIISTNGMSLYSDDID